MIHIDVGVIKIMMLVKSIFKDYKIIYNKCFDEYGILDRFLGYFRDNYPHMLVGYNSDFFDVPMIIQRMKKILGKKKTNSISPFGLLYKKMKQNTIW